jgi:hypothetical protein
LEIDTKTQRHQGLVTLCNRGQSQC